MQSFTVCLMIGVTTDIFLFFCYCLYTCVHFSFLFVYHVYDFIIIIIIIIMISAGEFPQFLVTAERLVICISEIWCWCSASMLFCYTTACRSLTARTEHHTLSVIFSNF